MKIYTSYFRTIPKLKPFQIPISTAVYDPDWFHNFKGINYRFINGNGVLLGTRCNYFINMLHGQDTYCGLKCRKDPSSCDFLRIYSEGLSKIDFKEFIENLESYVYLVQQNLEFLEDPEVIFIVCEGENNKCSERGPIQHWFAKYGWNVEELKVDLGPNYSLPKHTISTLFEL